MADTILIPDQDERIRCLTCDYNLTGITSGRCPECGADFDREALLAGSRPAIPIWEESRCGPVVYRFLVTTLALALRPKQFVGRFPMHPNIPSARGFCGWCYLLAAILVGPLSLAVNASWEMILLAFAWLVGSWVCQFLVTRVVLLSGVNTYPVSSWKKNYYVAIGYMLAAFVPLSGLTIATFLLNELLGILPVTSFVTVGFLLGVLAWWMIVVTKVKFWTTSPRSRNFEMFGAIMIALTVIVVIAAILGACCSLLAALFLYSMG